MSQASRGPLSQDEKDHVYETIKKRVTACPKYVCGGSCLLWAWFGMLELRKLGVRAAPVAGDAQWPRIDLTKIDEHPEPESTHLSFVWSPMTPQSLWAMATGNLPEIHVWLYLLDENSLVDFTTGEWPSICNKHTQYPWLAAPPPNYLWCPPDQTPEGVFYRPVAGANHYLLQLLRQYVAYGTLPKE